MGQGRFGSHWTLEGTQTPFWQVSPIAQLWFASHWLPDRTHWPFWQLWPLGHGRFMSHWTIVGGTHWPFWQVLPWPQSLSARQPMVIPPQTPLLQA